LHKSAWLLPIVGAALTTDCAACATYQQRCWSSVWMRARCGLGTRREHVIL